MPPAAESGGMDTKPDGEKKDVKDLNAGRGDADEADLVRLFLLTRFKF